MENFSCTPNWLQRFHNAKYLLLMLGICAFIQSFVVNAIFPVGLSTLEKRFKMTSTHTGIISSWYDFAVLLVVFPVCHWGNSVSNMMDKNAVIPGHKGRWIGWGGVVMALGSLVCALPHWLIAPYQPEDSDFNSTDFGQCTFRWDEIGETNDPCVNPKNGHDNRILTRIKVIVVTSGKMREYFEWRMNANSIIDRELEERVCERQPLSSYLNPYFLLFVLGQTLHGVGSTPLFSIGTTFIDENVSQKASPVYLAIHAVLTSFGPVIGVFVGGFLLNIYDDFDRVDNADLLCKTFEAKKICRNPTVIVCIVMGIFESIIINGFAAFMPKILETLLSTTPMLASYLSSVVIFAAAAGVMIGGMVIRQLKLQVGGMLKMIVCCHLIALIFTTGLLIHCPQRSFVGINTDYEDTYCNIDCGYSVYVLMVTLFITVVASFASGIPTQQIMLRVVPFDQRTLALGINWTFLRLLAIVCKLLSILTALFGYMTYRPTDLDNGTSIRSVDSLGALHLVVNDDRPAEQFFRRKSVIH
uniref:Solute carrier organic anion transporter family member n=1 Tax=Angiostrongylus cantonensis TaxID=6313 RepID=A0A0K0D973_ANGCA